MPELDLDVFSSSSASSQRRVWPERGSFFLIDINLFPQDSFALELLISFRDFFEGIEEEIDEIGKLNIEFDLMVIVSTWPDFLGKSIQERIGFLKPYELYV